MRIDAGDTAWVCGAAALVMFMTPGLALFYGGMVRAKNVLAMLMQNFFCLGLVSVLWAGLVYSLAFGGTNHWLGNFDFVWLRNFGSAPPGLALTIPPSLYMAYQMMFAVITPALITGAIADRMRFGAWVWFLGLWVVLVYAPIAHWVFAPAGWLARRGALDFAGGTVVHVNAGIAALAVVVVLGRRRGWPGTPMPPHSLPLTLIGTGILWFGWFGFNAGSALGANALAVQALVNTHLAAAAAMLGWLVVERLHGGHATTLGAASGAVAGLVAITPCAGFVGGMSPVAIGLVAGGLCYGAVNLKFKLGFDDALDVVGVHLVGGIAGSLLLGFFADRHVNAAGRTGVLLGGGWGLFGDQVVAVVATLVYSFAVTFAIVWVLARVLPGGVRVDGDEEDSGLDLGEHSETGYAFAER
jgi:ammonium transporter, Amt family